MNEQQYNYFLSNPRFKTYLQKTGNDIDKAIKLYKLNIQLSEAFYPILAILEISLRNAIHYRLTVHFQDPYWFNNKLPNEFNSYVLDATKKLTTQKKAITSDRLVAELNLGFWNRLFNRKCAALLWKPLRVIFINTPKNLRQRDKIDESIYKIRTLRNRIFHFEPIFYNLNEIETRYNNMLILLKWLDNDLPKLIDDIDQFTIILEKAKNLEL